MLTWLFKFLVCALVIAVVVYVCYLLMGMVPEVPSPVRIIIMLIVGVACLIAAIRYIGMPPGEGSP